MTISPFLLAVFVLAVVPFASSSKSAKSAASPSTKTVPAAPQLVASSVVCESRGTCLVEGSRCTRGYETCFGETFDLFVCDCVDIDGGGNLEYSCRFNDACRTAPTEIFRQPSLSSAKAGKSSKSSKGSSKSSTGYSEAHGILYPVAPLGSAKSSKAYGSSKSSKAYGSAKAAKASTKAFKSSKGSQNLAYVNLFTHESEIAIITNAPTNDPTKASTNDPSNTPTNRPTSEPTKRIIRSFSVEQCTGDPCPVETHCRSSYDTCGPGSMHCNKFSSWKPICPAVPTTTTPTQKPTTEPTGNPTSSEPTAFPTYGELLTAPRPATPSPTTTEPTVEEALTPKFIAPVDMDELFLVQQGSPEESFETSDSGLKEEVEGPKTRDAVVDDKKKPSGLALGLGLGLGAVVVIGLALVGVHYYRRSLLTEALPESLN